MLNRLSLRIKITVLMFISMSFLTILISSVFYYSTQASMVRIGLFTTSIGIYQSEYNFDQQTELNISPPIEILALENYFQNGLRQDIFSIAIIFIIFSSLIAFILATKVSKPINYLATAISRVTSENLNVEIPLPKSDDEITKLTQNFNSMMKKLSNSFESKKLFAQNAAHELKTPLSSMRANIDILEIDENPTIEEYKETMHIVKNNTERLINLVEGLLSLNNQIEDEAKVNLNLLETIQEIMDELNDEVKKKALRVAIGGEATKNVNEILFKQALKNIIHNAIRYNDYNGSIEISISQKNIQITDTGFGIPNDALKNIFDPFYCVDKSRSKKLGGNGLGLAIAKNIFENHDMKLQIESDLGLGTTATITF